MNAHFDGHPGAEMKGFSCWCQPQDFRRVHLSSQYIRDESGGNTEEVIWLSHPGAGCQTWHSSFPNDYNMLNLLSSPPGRKFSKKEPDLHFSSMLWIQKKFLKPQWREDWNSSSLFSHCLPQEASPQSSQQGLPAINQKLQEWNGVFTGDHTKCTESDEEQTVKDVF